MFHVKLSLVRQLLAVMFGLKVNPHDSLIWNSNEFETPDPNGTLAGCYRNQTFKSVEEIMGSTRILTSL